MALDRRALKRASAKVMVVLELALESTTTTWSTSLRNCQKMTWFGSPPEGTADISDMVFVVGFDDRGFILWVT